MIVTSNLTALQSNTHAARFAVFFPVISSLTSQLFGVLEEGNHPAVFSGTDMMWCSVFPTLTHLIYFIK